jgi:TolB protein
MIPRIFVPLFAVVLLVGCQLKPFAPSAPAPVGELAYIARDGNIYVTDASLTKKVAITRDATTAPEGSGRSYHRVSWSPGGQLAFASVTRNVMSATSQIFVVPSIDASPRLIIENDQNFVIYIYWSPVACPDRPQCWQLTYLKEEDAGQIALFLVELTNEQITTTQTSLGRPFYFSWHPDGERIVSHTGGARRFNPEAQLHEYDIAGNTIEPFQMVPGLFFAPTWSPQGDQWLAVLADGETDQLYLLDKERPLRKLVESEDNRIAFIWSPQGDKIAYAIRKHGTDPLFDPIHVLDLKTGQVQQITDNSFRISSFFWSPDGEKIAYLQQPDVRGEWLQWRVYNLKHQEDRGHEIFVPSFQMLYVLGSFDQYARSHRLWSPDSRYLVYADRDKQLVERIWLLDTTAHNSTPPRFVDEGTFGVWSWR